jgi:deoxyribodipyrimidine photo-lyase
VLDPKLLSSSYVGRHRIAFLFAGLRQLDADLRACGSHLIVREGPPEDELDRLLRDVNADAIFAEEDISPYSRKRDERVARHLPLHLTPGLTVFPPGSILKADGTPYTVFSPFARRWKSLQFPSSGSLLCAPSRLGKFADLASLPIPDVPAPSEHIPFDAGEAAARRRLSAFVDGHDAPIYAYATSRNQLDTTGTSQLSPYLRLGMVSARQAAVSAFTAMSSAPSDSARSSAEVWLNELIWREFFIHILHHFPDVRYKSFRRQFRDIPWNNDRAAFRAWCNGNTGYPSVDAAMRQLSQSGWIHNRARMIVASFLVKDLLIDWRWGEKWFMRCLVDGDPAANNGGWQWSAGTGTDAAPYFRIFNPVLQSKKHDPDGVHIRRWIPELRKVPDKFIHEPWRMSSEEQMAHACILDQDYPHPIVDHVKVRKTTIAVFKKAAR